MTFLLSMPLISSALTEDEPFFLYVPFCIPHARYEVPELGDYEDKDWDKDARAYAAMITRMDRSVGLIMEAVKEAGIHENTIVFFTSDNGAAENTLQWPFFRSNGNLRGVKRDPYEGGIRVPMIVSYPGKISPGSKSELPWYFADVLPTLGALTGSQVPDNIDGISVLPTLLGEEQNPGPRPLYWEFYEMEGWRAVRFGPWKAIQQICTTRPRQTLNFTTWTLTSGSIVTWQTSILIR